jgi:mono/diheme cytochrome c family protein
MKTVFKWIGIVLVGILVLLLLALGVVYFVSNSHFNETYTVNPAPVTVPPADSAVLARGEHVATIRGCVECHGDNFGGKIFFDDAALVVLYASNLTSGEGGVGGSYTDADWVRAIRHGINPDGQPLLFMPSHEYYPLSDDDVGALIAYIHQAAPVDNVQPEPTVGPIGRILYLADLLPLVPAELIDHEAPRPEAPMPGVTVEYGRYLSTGCVGCHGNGYSGGPIPGAPPDWPPPANITPHETGLASWTEADFMKLIRTGTRPDGRVLDTAYMPWQLLKQLTDDEIKAVWRFLQSLPPTPYGNR